MYNRNEFYGRNQEDLVRERRGMFRRAVWVLMGILYGLVMGNIIKLF